MKRKSSKTSSKTTPFGALVELKRAVGRVAERVSARAAEREQRAPISAIRLLKRQHAEVKALFKTIETARTRDAKVKAFQELAANLVAHDTIEREIFYPACEKAMGMTKLLGEALVEHGLVEFSLYQADQARGREAFDFKVQVLSEVVQHHVKEEESDFFPEVESALGDEALEQLGGQMRERFELAKAQDFRGTLRQNLEQVLAGALKPSEQPKKSARRSPTRAVQPPKSSRRPRAAKARSTRKARAA